MNGLLKEHLDANHKMKNSGLSNEDIQTAALTLIAERLVILTTPIITHEPEELTGTDKPSLSKADADD